MPRRPEVYGTILREKIACHGATCWLVNTGWTGGAYGVGSRMPIKATRALLTAALSGDLHDAEFRKDEHFGFHVPIAVQGVDMALLIRALLGAMATPTTVKRQSLFQCLQITLSNIFRILTKMCVPSPLGNAILISH